MSLLVAHYKEANVELECGMWDVQLTQINILGSTVEFASRMLREGNQ